MEEDVEIFWSKLQSKTSENKPNDDFEVLKMLTRNKENTLLFSLTVLDLCVDNFETSIESIKTFINVSMQSQSVASDFTSDPLRLHKLYSSFISLLSRSSPLDFVSEYLILRVFFILTATLPRLSLDIVTNDQLFDCILDVYSLVSTRYSSQFKYKTTTDNDYSGEVLHEIHRLFFTLMVHCPDHVGSKFSQFINGPLLTTLELNSLNFTSDSIDSFISTVPGNESLKLVQPPFDSCVSLLMNTETYPSSISTLHLHLIYSMLIISLKYEDEEGAEKQFSLLLSLNHLLRHAPLSHLTYLKSIVLPDTMDRTRPLSIGDASYNILLASLTNTARLDYKVALEDFLWVLNGRDVHRMVYYVGYAPLASFLLRMNLLTLPDPKDGCVTDDGESIVDALGRIDIMTGALRSIDTVEKDEMTEDEKEKEAERIGELLHKLEKTGLVKMVRSQ